MTDRACLELLALRLMVHGPEAATHQVVRALARSPLWVETRSLLREHGFRQDEIAFLMGVAHPEGCACWTCIKRLRERVRAHQVKLKRRVATAKTR